MLVLEKIGPRDWTQTYERRKEPTGLEAGRTLTTICTFSRWLALRIPYLFSSEMHHEELQANINSQPRRAVIPSVGKIC